MSQSLPMQPGIGFPPDSQVDLLRKLVWNTWFLSTAGGGSGIIWAAAPATSTSSGIEGQVAYDDSYFYVCVANNTWRRVPISDWA